MNIIFLKFEIRSKNLKIFKVLIVLLFSLVIITNTAISESPFKQIKLSGLLKI